MTALSEAQAALAELRQATLGFQQARAANPNTWLQTHNSKCEQHLVATIKLLGGQAAITPKPPAPPQPPPAPAVDLSPVRNLLVFATVDADTITQALTLPQRWRFVFSADPVYWPDDAQVERVKRARGAAYVWCDCHSTMPAEAKRLNTLYGLQGWYGQGENADEFDVCLAAGGKWAIVNLSALTPTQLISVATARALVTNENYRNVHPAERPDWRNANTGVGGNTIAVYGSASEGAVYTSIQNYVNNGWFNPQTDSIYTEGMTANDWQVLRSLG